MISVTKGGKGIEMQTLTGVDGEPDRIRTCDPLIKSQLLYQLSYGPTSFCVLFQFKMVKFNLNFYMKLVKNFTLEEKITLRYKSAWKK